MRNSRVIDVIGELKKFGVEVDVHDPRVDPADALEEHGIALLCDLKKGYYDGIILAVPHDEFRARGSTELRSLGHANAVLFDIKSMFSAQESDLRL